MATGFGETLVRRGVIDESTLERALAHRAEHGDPLGRILVEWGAATEADVVAAIATEFGIDFVDTRAGCVDPTAAALVPRSVALELGALPVAFKGHDALVVAVADPSDQEAVTRIEALTGMRVEIGLTVRSDLVRAIEALSDVDTASDRNASTAPPPMASANESNGSGTSGMAANDSSPSASNLLAFEQESVIDLDEVLAVLVERGGSDLHLTAGVPPIIRVHGSLQPLEEFGRLVPNEIQKVVYAILTQRQREQFENELELDLSYQVPRMARFRVNVFQQRDSMGAVLRIIPFDIKSIDDLGIPPQVTNFAHLPRGFVLVTGPTGSGKSTTLASLIDVVNRERSCHIMTIEDPIEFLHKHNKSIVNQRELGTDTHTFAAALKHVLRQDPDVILVGELRDLETIQVALTAAETGHLVFGTLHTQDAPQTVDRIVDVFPPHQQEQIRVMLGGALQGVLCQQLLPTSDGRGRAAACEVMVATSAIKNLIREGKTHQMYSSIQAGKQYGMVTMDQSLADLVKKGVVTYDTALEKCNNVADFNRLCGRA